jgi:hypothetical protein
MLHVDKMIIKKKLVEKTHQLQSGLFVLTCCIIFPAFACSTFGAVNSHWMMFVVGSKWRPLIGCLTFLAHHSFIALLQIC